VVLVEAKKEFSFKQICKDSTISYAIKIFPRTHCEVAIAFWRLSSEIVLTHRLGSIKRSALQDYNVL